MKTKRKSVFLPTGKLKSKIMKNQKTNEDFINQQHESHKRKWPYNEENSYQNFSMDKNDLTKKCMITYDYENNYQHSIPTTNGQAQLSNTMNNATAICNQQQQPQPQSTQILNTMEISENIEYVNILYDDDLLTSIQAPVATETNYINFEPNWGNADILDLDQRNYYYETTNSNQVNLNDLNDQMAQSIQQDSTNHTQQYHVHRHHHHHTDSLQSQHHLQDPTTNNQIQTEYEVIQNVFCDANESDRENGRSNLRE